MVAGLILSVVMATAAKAPHPQEEDPLTGVRVTLSASWMGRATTSEDKEILVLAGHADSQGIEGAGTSGAAVDRGGARPMNPHMRDELFWNRRVRDAVVKTGQARGLNIRSYEPDQLTIRNEDDPRTNWSVGRRHHDAGGYALEIHFDAYGNHGVGSGLIPNLRSPATRIDESLALNFGRYPLNFRGGLGAPRRGISILEIGKLEGQLERKLRDPQSRNAVVAALALRIVEAIELGIGEAPATRKLSSPPDADDSVPQATDHQTNVVGG
ncbi:hypothetical protein MITS9509_00081 [Synechococcus sp. MIT S9509]|nr:hypothetical protein MITS9504_01384 [Synechococcus sp. MIT S9504]KZR93494.1 hypothetical protein MITS9509_00081 [Synechococcus sp. MIT S9509]